MRINGWRCGVDPEFIRLPLQFLLDHLHGETSLTTVKHPSAINGTEVPIPPLAEQRRIIPKVDALMALCDRLQVSLEEAPTTRRRLLDGVLAEALAPVEACEREAAE
jgi:type I restriction enzyme S subunit